MIKAAIKHTPNSNMAYAYDTDHLHIYLQTGKDDIDKVEMLFGDPHDWVPVNGQYYWVIETKERKALEKKYTTQLFDYWFIEEVAPFKRAKYAFILYQGDEVYFYGSKKLIKIDLEKDRNIIYDGFEYFCYPYMNETDIVKPLPWIKNTIWYQIFPERFRKGKNTKGNYLPWGEYQDHIDNKMFFGGNISGIIEAIPYMQNLGINGIYFTPIFYATSAHKYDTIDYFKIDPSFGTNQEFKQMVKACHEAGIKVMLDAVFNHCGWFHPYFQDVVRKGKKSKYYDCFYIESDEIINFPLENNAPKVEGRIYPNYRTFAFTPFMPKLNTSHPIMEKYLLKVANFWVKNFDIDGWRLDVSNEVSHAFWRKFKQVVTKIKPDIYILGENWEDSTPWLGPDQFNAVMNYELTYPIWQFFTFKDVNRIDAQEFSYKINELLVRYPRNVAVNMFNLIDSHDTMRILHRANQNKDIVKLAYLFIFSFCGSPAIFYGDEVGLDGGKDPDNRRCMIWDEQRQDKDLFAFFKRLITLRKSFCSFSHIDIKWLYTRDNILIYQKDDIFFIMNNNNQDVNIVLPRVMKHQNYIDLYLDEKISLDEVITIKNYGFSILKNETN
jgi:glycosidase